MPALGARTHSSRLTPHGRAFVFLGGTASLPLGLAKKEGWPKCLGRFLDRGSSISPFFGSSKSGGLFNGNHKTRNAALGRRKEAPEEAIPKVEFGEPSGCRGRFRGRVPPASAWMGCHPHEPQVAKVLSPKRTWERFGLVPLNSPSVS